MSAEHADAERKRNTTDISRGEDARTVWVWLPLLTALAILLRAIGLNGGLWYDEISTLVDSVRAPLYEIVTAFPSNNQHTLFSVLAHFSVNIFGEHAWSLRLPSLVLGAATVPMLYVFAREFVRSREALLASLLLACAYHPVWFSQNARGYSALAFLTLLSSWLLLRGLRRGRPGDFVWYAVAAALGVYAHLTMVFLVASHALLCVIPLGLPGLDAARLRRWRWPALGFLLAGVFTLLVYSPVLLDLQQFFLKRPSPMEVATPKWAALELVRGLRIGLGAGIGVLIGAGLFATGLWSYFKQSRFVTGVFVLPGVITVAAALVLRRPVFPRFLFFLVGFALLIVVRGALEIGRRVSRRSAADPTGAPAVGIALVVIMTLLSAAPLALNYRYPKQDFEGPLHFVEKQHVDGEPIVTVGLTTYVYREYYRRRWEDVTSLEEFQKVRSRGRRVWVLYTLEGYIQSRTPDLMKTLRAECAVAGVFRGTVGNGDVKVCVAARVSSPAQ